MVDLASDNLLAAEAAKNWLIRPCYLRRCTESLSHPAMRPAGAGTGAWPAGAMAGTPAE